MHEFSFTVSVIERCKNAVDKDCADKNDRKFKSIFSDNRHNIALFCIGSQKGFCNSRNSIADNVFPVNPQINNVFSPAPESCLNNKWPSDSSSSYSVDESGLLIMLFIFSIEEMQLWMFKCSEEMKIISN